MAAPSLLELLPTLADPVRARLLLVAEPLELSVGELCDVLQQPQSTMSRHLKHLSEAGWLTSRAQGTSRFYRLAPDLPGHLAELWRLVREETRAGAAARHDAERLRHVLAARAAGGRGFSTTAAQQWDGLRAELFGHRAELLAMLGLLEPDWTVADLGCGTGQLISALAPFVGQVIGIDASAPMLAAARTRLAGLPNVDLREGDLARPPLAPGELDLAIMSLVLPVVDDPEAVVVAALDALRPSGRLVITDLLPHDRPEFRQALEHRRNGTSEAELRAWCASGGASAVRVVALPLDPAATGPALFTAIATRQATDDARPTTTGRSPSAGTT